MSKENNQNETAEMLEEDQVSLSSQNEGSDSKQSPAADMSDNGFEQELGDSSDVEALKDELAQAKEQAIRAAAEAQNIRRRAEQDVEKAHKYGLEKFVSDMLPVADNLERALDAASAEGANFSVISEGVALTLKSLTDALKRHKVDQIDPVGEPFDPQLHQAMTMIEQADAEPNSVINVFQKGYSLNGRLVRPAMVVVAKAPAINKGEGGE